MLPEPLPADPMTLLAQWLDEAMARRDTPNPNSMTLATVDLRGGAPVPDARIVLCKQIEPGPPSGGSIVFYTNRASRKGQQLAASPRAALVFHWDALDRQARLDGPITLTSDAESDAYFASRPWESRIGAWASEQSRPVASRHELLARVRATMERFGIDPARPPAADARVEVPRPPHWGGYRVHAERVELWVSGAGRVHDRAEWRRTLAPQGSGFRPAPWVAVRLQP
jgi:pyridoxamine 5'-phosphate oxidase